MGRGRGVMSGEQTLRNEWIQGMEILQLTPERSLNCIEDASRTVLTRSNSAGSETGREPWHRVVLVGISVWLTYTDASPLACPLQCELWPVCLNCN